MTDPTPRDELRKKLFKHKEFKSKIINVFDADIELRQPTIGEVLNAKDYDNNAEAIAGILINYAYVPGTNDRVFDKNDADLNEILSWPMTDWITTVQKAAVDLMNLNVEDAEKNLEAIKD